MRFLGTCPDCGDFEVPAEKVLVVAYPRCVDRNHVRMSCPRCNRPLMKTPKVEAFVALRQGGSPVKTVNLPYEVLEAHYEGDALSQDEILDFMLDLEREDDLSALAG